MKRDEMTTVKKTFVTLGTICGFAYFILSAIDRSGLLSIPEAFMYPLFSAFWVSIAITQSNKKLAMCYYFVAAGYGLLALVNLFF